MVGVGAGVSVTLGDEDDKQRPNLSAEQKEDTGGAGRTAGAPHRTNQEVASREKFVQAGGERCRGGESGESSPELCRRSRRSRIGHLEPQKSQIIQILAKQIASLTE